jgi:hypothetical protein
MYVRYTKVLIKFHFSTFLLAGPDMSSVLLSLPHVSRLIRTLVQVLELDVSDQKILEESGMGARQTTSMSTRSILF